jgi:putative transposase
LKLNELKVNSKLLYFGKQYIVVAIDPPNVIIKRFDNDGEAISIRFSDLVLNPSFIAGKSMVKKIEKENEYCGKNEPAVRSFEPLFAYI